MNDMYKVMIVDDNMTNLIMAKKILEEIYEVVPVSAGKTALEFLHDMPDPPDIILLDIDMPDVNGFYVLSEMRNDPRLADVRVIFLTAQDDPTTEVEGYYLGAVDYIKKPYTTALLRKRLEVHVQSIEATRKLRNYNESLSKTLKDKVHNIVELEYALVEIFASLMAVRSHMIAEHCERVQKYMDIFLEEIMATGRYALADSDREMLVFSSKLHDMGKLCMTDRCLADMGDLSLQEKEFNHAHTIIGAEACKKVTESMSGNTFLQSVYNMCRSHHERWDGKGYPDRLMTTDIPLEARVLAIVNSYDNFRNHNDGADPLTHEEAVKRISLWSGTQFDPDLVDIFLSCSDRFERIPGR
ncbi:MAG: response regulator [Lachnospiraceae bacterium]|nr:response regulator [Lachnospiraceae bacterium]